MEKILTKYVVSVSELKKSPSATIKQCKEHPIAILNHNKPIGYIISEKKYRELMEQLEEKTFEDMVGDRLKHIEEAEDFEL